MGVIEQKKEAKRQRLLDAAYELFLKQGILHTSIDDIVKRGQVAKGTFYLYFNDKTTLLEALTIRVSHEIAEKAYAEAIKTPSSLPDGVIRFVDYIIEYFRREPAVLRLLQRNFGWALLQSIINRQDDPLVRQIRSTVLDSEEMRGRSEREVLNLVFVLAEMVGSVCYASIVRGQPDNIDQLKPVLYGVIRSSLQAGA